MRGFWKPSTATAGGGGPRQRAAPAHPAPAAFVHPCTSKGRVERAIRTIRDQFWPARHWKDLDDLNAQAEAWCNGWAMDRPCPEDRSIPVREAFAQENLLPLPDTPYPTDERVEVRIGKTPYARFDRNDYSVPHTQVQRILTVVASPTTVRILEGAEEVACHPRSYDKGQQIEQPEHLEALVQIKRQARRHRGQDRLTQAAPSSQRLLTQAAERGDNLGSITASLLRLLEDYGASELEAAIADSLAAGVAHPNGVRIALERRREAAQLPPPLGIRIDHEQARELVVRPHDLGGYDPQDGETAETEVPDEA